MKKTINEYPNYNQTGTVAKQLATSKSTMGSTPSDLNKSSPSPTTTGKTPKKPAALKARELQVDQQFPDEKGNMLKVISPFNQGRNKEAIVVQDEKTKEYFTLGKDDMVNLGQVDESIDDIFDRKKNLARKLARKGNKLKQLIRAAKFDKQESNGGVIFEINFNSAEVVKSALDAPIKCGFEAETVWTDVSASGGFEELDNSMSWYDVSRIIDDFTSHRDIDSVDYSYREWLQDGPLIDIEGDIVERMADEYLEDEYKLDEYIEEFIDMDDVEDYRDDIMADLRSKTTQQDMFTDNDEESSKENDIEYAERQDWDKSAWAREFVETEHRDEFLEWAREQIRDNGEAWDEANEEAEQKYDVRDWMLEVYGNWYDMLSAHDIYVPGPDDDEGEGGLEEVADLMIDWANENSRSDMVRAGGYHSGKSVDNTYWRVENDPSIDGSGAKAEIISPVYDTPREMLTEMKSLFEYFNENNVETNRSTGLHVTMSMMGEGLDINHLKLAVLLGDQYVLKQFGREFNSYTSSQQKNIVQYANRIAKEGDIDQLSSQFKELENMLGRGISYTKYSSINFKSAKNEDGNQLIEFRIMGGGNYDQQFEKVSKAIIRYGATLQAAYNPDAYKKDYIKAIMKLVNAVKDGNVDDGEVKKTLGGGEIPATPFADAVKQLMHRDMYLDGLENVKAVEWYIANDDIEGAKSAFMWVMQNILTGIAADKAQAKRTSKIVRAIREKQRQLGVTNDDIMKRVYSFYMSMHSIQNKGVLLRKAAGALTAITMKPVDLPQIQVVKYDSNTESLLMNLKRYNELMFNNSIEPPLTTADFKVVDIVLLSKALKLKHEGQSGAELEQFRKQYGIEPGITGEAKDNEWIVVGTGASRASLEYGIEVVRESISAFDKFDRLPLQEQLAILAKVDKRKLDEAWNKKKQVKAKEPKPKAKAGRTKHPYKGRLVGEDAENNVNETPLKSFDELHRWQITYNNGKTRTVRAKTSSRARDRASDDPNLRIIGIRSVKDLGPINIIEGAVPETNMPDEYRQIMSKPLLGSDLKGQMYAYQIVPDPAMLKEFRIQIANAGKEADLRPIFKSFAQAKLHPTQKKKVGLGESIEESVIGKTPAASKYIVAINNLLALNPPHNFLIGTKGERGPMVPTPGQQISSLNDSIQGTINGESTTALVSTLFKSDEIKLEYKRTEAEAAGKDPTKVTISNKEAYKIKPSDIFGDEKFNATQVFDKVIKNPILMQSEIGQIVIQLAEQIQQGKYPDMSQVPKEYITAITNYAGEYLGVLAMIKGIADFPTVDQWLEHLDVTNIAGITVQFPTSTNFALADSIGSFENSQTGNQILISSKAGKKGAPPSLNNLKVPTDMKRKQAYKTVIDFVESMQQASGAEQAFVGLNKIYEHNPDAIPEPVRKLLPFTEKDVAYISKFMDPVYDKQDLVKLEKKWQTILGLVNIDRVDGRATPGGIVLYTLIKTVIICVNQNNAYPNFESLAREILQKNFIQIFTDVKGGQLTSRVLWPNRDLATGKVELYSKASAIAPTKMKMSFSVT